jgi:3-oxoacyl-[acyl-carrier protein] reductase
MTTLAGKSAVVTGGSRGIGRAIVRRLAADGGRVISISTLNTAAPGPGIALYCASKAALEQFTRVAAHELGPRGITANIVSPGATDTELLRASNSPESLERAAALTALGRLGTPADIADVVAFLAGPDAGGSPARTSRRRAGSPPDHAGARAVITPPFGSTD